MSGAAADAPSGALGAAADDAPLVTVCIPAYNAARTLGATLDSVLAQRYPALQVIVCDNHSTDGTGELVDAYAPRGVVHRRPPSPDGRVIGSGMNWTAAIGMGDGEFLALFHADDLYEPEIVAREVALMRRHPGMTAVFTMRRAIGDDGEPLDQPPTTMPRAYAAREALTFAEFVNSILAHDFLLATPSILIRRSALDGIGAFDEATYGTTVDIDMWLRLARRGPIGVIHEPLLRYRVSSFHSTAVYNRRRTAEHDLFRMMDRWLADPAVAAIAEPWALARYELLRGADGVRCALTAWAVGDGATARARLRPALRARNLLGWWRFPKLAPFHAVAALLRGARLVGLERPLARAALAALDARERRRRARAAA